MVRLDIGVTEYSGQKFDAIEAERMLNEAYDLIERQYPASDKFLVSGLTDVGIPALAYRAAVRRGWKTVGIACGKAAEYDCFPVDETVIVGTEWGQESSRFLSSIDVLIRVGGGGQAKRETAQAKELRLPVFEYDLAAIPPQKQA